MTSLGLVATVITVAATAILLLAEARARPRLKALAKTASSLGFVMTCLALGNLARPYARAIFVALVLSFVGDLLLLSTAKRTFKLGLLAFLLGHVAFTVAFTGRGIDLTIACYAGACLFAVGILVLRWLEPHLPRGMKIPVIAYVLVISAMLACALGTRIPIVIVSALAFYLSDLSVARDRFVEKSFVNKAWGLPLYYAAQLGLAWSVAGL